MTSRLVDHTPVWAPAQLATDLEGNTAPGWECVHQLENGNGYCGGNVFRIEDAVGDHCTHVYETPDSFTCPRCGATSHHPMDVKEGYCGRCHDWTGEGA